MAASHLVWLYLELDVRYVRSSALPPAALHCMTFWEDDRIFQVKNEFYFSVWLTCDWWLVGQTDSLLDIYAFLSSVHDAVYLSWTSSHRWPPDKHTAKEKSTVTSLYKDHPSEYEMRSQTGGIQCREMSNNLKWTKHCNNCNTAVQTVHLQ